MRVEQAKGLKELEKENGRLKKHISMLKQKRVWSVLRLVRYDKEDQERTDKQTEDCRYLLSNPELISEKDREFLTAECSSRL